MEATTLSNLIEMFNKRMTCFEEELSKSSSMPTSTVSGLAADFVLFKTFIGQALTNLQKQVEHLARNADDREMRSRRKILLLHGVPEQTKETTSSVIVEVMQKKAKIVDFSNGDIKRCHRMGRSTATHKPRPILIKFRDTALRDKIWFAKSSLKGTGVTLSEFLTKRRHEAFMAAREKFGVANCWTKEGCVYIVKGDGSRHRISCSSDINQIEPQASPKPKAAGKVASGKNKRTAALKK